MYRMSANSGTYVNHNLLSENMKKLVHVILEGFIEPKLRTCQEHFKACVKNLKNIERLSDLQMFL